MNFSWFLSPDITLLAVLLFAAAVILVQRRKITAQIDIWKDSMDSPGYGLVLFDQDEILLRANTQAFAALPFLQEKIGSKYGLPDFLNYLFDASVEIEESLSKAVDRAAEKIFNQGFRDVIRTEDGRVFAVEVQKTPKGLTVVIMVDLESYQQQEKHYSTLSRTNYQLLQAVQATANPIVVSDAKGVNHDIIFSNKAFSELAELESEELVDVSLKDWFYSFCRDEVYETLLTALEAGEDADVDVSVPGVDQSVRWYNIKLTPVMDERGELDLFVSVFTDTTELKMREAEFFQSKKLEALGQLAAGVAHDFNNVLSIVNGYARMTAQNLGDHEKVGTYLDKISAASERGAALTKQMLTFSRHKVVMERVINMPEAVGEQEALLMPLLGAGIKLKIESAENYLPVECSLDALGQILMNLCVNARDAMPKGGTLSVEVGQASYLPDTMADKSNPHGYAFLSVQDTGTGMKKEVMERIFDPFYTTKQQGQGTGLGLSMVYGLVQEMGGHIEVVSEVGQGTTFTVFLPLSDKEPGKKASGSLEDVSSLRLEGYTALVAEDEEGLLETVTDMLEKMGMKVIGACNGNDALLKQDEYEGEIDLLLTDVIMPELNGVKLAQLFKSLRPEAKIIFMSGYPAGSRESNVDLPDLPEDALFVAKPFNYDELARLIYGKLIGGEQSDMKDQSGITTAHWETVQK